MLQALADIASLIYPARCLCCGVPAAGGAAFCDACDAKLNQLIITPRCPKCAAPLAEGAACGRCESGGIYPFDRVVALAPFREPLRKLIHQIKYHHRWPVAEILADRLVAHEPARELLEKSDCLVAVPLHWSRHLSRGYNQADALARRLGSRLGKPVIETAYRKRRTESQTGIRAHALRQENLRGAFAGWHLGALRSRRVTLVDDVMTSAATLRSLARVLRAAEPQCLSAVVLAVADPRHRDFQTA